MPRERVEGKSLANTSGFDLWNFEKIADVLEDALTPLGDLGVELNLCQRPGIFLQHGGDSYLVGIIIAHLN